MKILKKGMGTLLTITDILTELNKDLALEYKAAVQYTQHYGVVTGGAFMPIRSALGEHAKEELSHALKLSDLIAYYGGTPTTDIVRIAPAAGAVETLKQDLADEMTAIGRYRKRIQQSEEIGYYELAEELRAILKDELDHANELKLALGR